MVGRDGVAGDARRTALTSRIRRVGAAGLALGLCLGAASTIPAAAATEELPVVGGLLGSVDGGLLGGLVGGLLQGEGGVFGHEGGVIAGDDQLTDVVAGFSSGGEVVGAAVDMVDAVGDVVADPNIGGEDSFDDPAVGGGALGGAVGGPLGGVLGGLLSGGTGLLGGVF